MSRILLLLLIVLWLRPAHGQELTVKSFVEKTNDLSASTHERKDLNGNSCALIKVQLATPEAKFSPNIMGTVDYKVNEYWVYLPTMSKHLEVKHPNFLTVDVVFADYGIKLEPKTTYSLVLQSSENNAKGITPFVKGIPIKMAYVEGGSLSKDGGQTAQKVESFYMSQTEVTVSLWNAVMSDNKEAPSGHPITYVSWIDSQKFIRKLNELTGLRFRMPSETEWEYAARGGKKGNGFTYSGSNDVNSVACNSRTDGPIDVAQKQANELGIFDMSGNVWEWCCNYCDGSPIISPDDLREKTEVVARGGSWKSSPRYCTVESRMCQKPDNRFNLSFVGIRLVLDQTASDAETSEKMKCETVTSADSIVLNLEGLRITFLPVEGGTFNMGATAEQKESAFANEFPVHKVCLNSFFMSKEKLCIPKQLFAKLGIKSDDKQLSKFTYQEALSLVEKLSELSQLRLSLPSEAEWEYAARGGKLSKNNIYSGTNEQFHQPEAMMTSNELHLVGMTEGSTEWTADTFAKYENALQTNPKITRQGDNVVVRGGELYSSRRRVSARSQSVTTNRNAIRLIIRNN